MEVATGGTPSPNENHLQPVFHVNTFKKRLQACGAVPVCRAGVQIHQPGIQPAHLCPTWKPQQTGLDGLRGKLERSQTSLAGDEKRKAFRPSRTSAPQRPSQAHPKVCIYFHSPLLISTRMLPLTPVHPRKGNVSVISFPKLSADAPRLSAALPPVSSAEPFNSPTHNMQAGGKPHASDGLQRSPEPFLGSNATELTGAKNTVNPACEIGGRPAEELRDVQPKAGPRQTAGRERMFRGKVQGNCSHARCHVAFYNRGIIYGHLGKGGEFLLQPVGMETPVLF